MYVTQEIYRYILGTYAEDFFGDIHNQNARNHCIRLEGIVGGF